MRKRGELPSEVDPDKLALATLAAVQGGLRLTRIRREIEPLEAALDTVLDYIQWLVASRASSTSS